VKLKFTEFTLIFPFKGEALAIIQERPEIIEQLRTNCIFLHQLIQAAIRDTGFNLMGVDIAPVKHIGYVHDDIEVVDGKLDSLVSEVSKQMPYNYFITFIF
jgi:hypothetical protein